MSSVGWSPHEPVLCGPVTDLLIHDPSGSYLDATAGGGGHTQAILARLNSEGRVVALDRDAEAITVLKQRFQDEPRVVVVQRNFRELDQVSEIFDLIPLAGILFDYGVSSHMLDAGERGFSHRTAAPLDMRMDRRDSLTAGEVVNEYDTTRLANILFEYGEEKRSRRIAAAIDRARPLETTTELANVIRAAVPNRDEAKTIARVFQAIRIEVNGELEAIHTSLPLAQERLRIGGRLVTMAYHSLEDRIVKRYIAERTKDCICNPRQPFCTCGGENATLRPVVKGALKADEGEIARNVRARSVRVRAAERVR